MRRTLATFRFLSTPSARRATAVPELIEPAVKFLSTPSARRATAQLQRGLCSFGISIHALREEGDLIVYDLHSLAGNFYPRPPRGGRPPIQPVCDDVGVFLSTPSARRATHYGWPEARFIQISIHALREEGDHWSSSKQMESQRFLSTPSARRATLSFSDCGGIRTNFYPRPPRGGRPYRHCNERPGFSISIHALREEGDMRQETSTTPSRNFYPRPPRGGRQAAGDLSQAQGHFYPRPPRGGRRLFCPGVDKETEFLSTPSARRATSRR